MKLRNPRSEVCGASSERQHRLIAGAGGPPVSGLEVGSVRSQHDLPQAERGAEREHLKFDCHGSSVVDCRFLFQSAPLPQCHRLVQPKRHGSPV